MFPSTPYHGWNPTPFSQATSLGEHPLCFPMHLLKCLLFCYHWTASPPHPFISPHCPSTRSKFPVPFLTFLSNFTTGSRIPPQPKALLPIISIQDDELYNIQPLNNLLQSRDICYHLALLSLSHCHMHTTCWRREKEEGKSIGFGS